MTPPFPIIAGVMTRKLLEQEVAEHHLLRFFEDISIMMNDTFTEYLILESIAKSSICGSVCHNEHSPQRYQKAFQLGKMSRGNRVV